MATQLSNPLGAIQVLDFGSPKVITAYAREIISGGALVYASGVPDVVSSGLNTFVSSDVTTAGGASGAQFLGMALQDTASGAACSVAVDGVFIVGCAGSVYSSQPVLTGGSSLVANLGSFIVTSDKDSAGTAGKKIGRALTGAIAGEYALVGFNAF